MCVRREPVKGGCTKDDLRSTCRHKGLSAEAVVLLRGYRRTSQSRLVSIRGIVMFGSSTRPVGDEMIAMLEFLVPDPLADQTQINEDVVCSNGDLP